SRYIVIPKDEQLHIRYYYKCTNDKCGKVSISEHQQDTNKCIYCGEDTYEHKFITPKYGFITDDKNKESTILKPKKTYSSEISYLGSLVPYDPIININDMTIVQCETNDKLMIVNETPSFFRNHCGYAVSDK